jgi:predicted nucleic acid-binding protein
MLYLDSSALVKRYVAEPHSAAVQAAIRRDPYVATAIVSVAEVRAALAAAQRAGRIATAPDLARVTAQFRQDWSRYIAVGVDLAVVEHAGDLAERHALRGYDAVQLACAVVASQSGRRNRRVRFGTFDAHLRAAAQAEGLALLF